MPPARGMQRESVAPCGRHKGREPELRCGCRPSGRRKESGYSQVCLAHADWMSTNQCSFRAHLVSTDSLIGCVSAPLKRPIFEGPNAGEPSLTEYIISVGVQLFPSANDPYRSELLL